MKKLLAIVLLLLLAANGYAANFYVRSTDGSNADSGATWALAKATLAGAFSAASAGDTIYVSQVHAETQASSMTLTSPGTAASPVRVICANDGAEPPTALATTATVTTTGTNNITLAGFAYFYGITFACGTGAGSPAFGIHSSSSAAGWCRFDSCVLSLPGAGTVNIGANAGNIASQAVEFNNTNLVCSSASNGVKLLSGFLRWTGGSVTTTAPTTLFDPTNFGDPFYAEIAGVDLSVMGSGKSLVNAAATKSGIFTFANCKLGAGVGVTTGSVSGQTASQVTLINCDSADTNYRFYRQPYPGTITHEITIVRTGGSTDGTTPFSRKMVSTANSKIYSPLESLPVTFLNESLSSVTVSAEVVTDGVTLTDADAWIEVEYLGNGSFPISTTITDRVSDIIFGTPANQTTSSATWTTTGLSSPVKQTLSVTFTPAEKGPIRAKVCLAKASTTMYVDQLRLSGSGRQYMIGAEGIINEAPTSSGGISRARVVNHQ